MSIISVLVLLYIGYQFGKRRNNRWQKVRVNMSKLDDIIAQKAYELDCLTSYRQIVESGDCNECKKKWECEYAPKPGQLVRYNCPHFQRK